MTHLCSEFVQKCQNSECGIYLIILEGPSSSILPSKTILKNRCFF